MAKEAPQGATPARALLALLEVVMVAVLGSIVVQVTFRAFNIGGGQILGDTFFLFLFMALETVITLALVLFLLRLGGGSLRKLGWVWAQPRPEVAVALVSVPFLFVSTFGVGIFFQALLPEYVAESNPLLDLITDHSDLLLFLTSSIFVGGLKEEVQRAFVLDRFERYVGVSSLSLSAAVLGWKSPPSEQAGKRVGLVLGLLLWSLFFAFGHHVQGIDNAAGAGVLGLLFGLLYIWRRNLVAPMLAHALYNVTTLMVFWTFVKES